MADKYEPYEKPSAVPGLAVTGAGIGALAYLARKKIPGLNILAKIAKKQPPPPLATRITPQATDKVTEVTKIAKTPTAQSLELIARPHPTKTYETFKGEMDLVAANAKAAPLTQGSDKGRFGSSLYDFIAQHPAYKPLDAKIWIKELSNFNRLAQFKSGQAGFQKVRMNVTKAELGDANILKFGGEKGDQVVGGFLMTARDAGMKVNKIDLLNMVNKSPAVNLRVKRFEYVTPMVEESRVLAKDLTKYIDDAEASIANYKGSVESTSAYLPLTKYSENLRATKAELGAIMHKIQYYHYNKNAPIESMVEAIKPFEKQIKSLEALSKQVAEDHKIGLDLNKLTEFRGHHTNLLRKLGREKTMNQSPRYGDHDTYKVLGDEKYIEDVVYYPKVIPYGRNVKPGDAGGGSHFETVAGVTFENQIYHVRYGRRAVDMGNQATGGRSKAYVVHEGQSDVQQAALKKIAEGGTRVNPFNTEQEYAQANHMMNEILKKMQVLAHKPKLNRAESFQFSKWDQQFEEIRRNTLNASKSLRRAGEEGKDVPFLPLLERDVWGDHLIKHMAKTAADDGVQWIAINPVERLHALKRASSTGENVVGKLGDWEFYGTATGKAGMRGVKAYSDKQSKEILTNPKMMAVLPERMKKLAVQYDSIAQPIKVAKSNPELPFKILKKHNFAADSPAKSMGYTKVPTEHEMAFKTLAEAEAYVGGKSHKIVRMEANDPRLYYEAFGLKITPQMLEQPFKLYKKEGGLVVNMFKW